jgi:hypothetical protein
LKSVAKRILIIIAILIGILLSLLIALILLIRLPTFQNFITQKAITYVSGKTKTRIELKRLYIAFPKSIVIENLFAEDLAHDTLLQLEKLSVDINMFALLQSKIELNNVELTNATVNIHRGADSVFNFNFFITAFAAKDTVKKTKEKPKTDKPSLQIQVNHIQLENVRARFFDEIGGTDIKGVIGTLALDMKAMNLKPLSFEGKELLLANTDVQMIQSSRGERTADTSIVLMPLLSLNKLKIDNVKFSYTDAHQQFKIHAGKLLVLPDKIDLNHQLVKIKELNLENTKGSFAMQTRVADTVKAKIDEAEKEGHGWKIGADKLLVKAVDFSFNITDAPHQKSGVDYKHLALRDVNAAINKVYYSSKEIHADIENISLREQSGFQLKQLTAKAVYDNQHAQLDNLIVVTNNTRISNTLGITYSGIKSLATDLGNMGVNAQLRNTSIAVDDILFFLPTLKEQSFFAANRGKVVTLNGDISGKLKDVFAKALTVEISDGTSLALDAHIVGLPKALDAFYDVQIKNLTTNNSSINNFAGGKIPASINLPKTLSLQGAIKGSFKDATAQLTLQTSSGDLQVDVNLKQVGNDTLYTIALQANKLDIGYILKQDSLLGTVTLSANLKGKNFSPNAMKDTLNAEIQSLQFMQHNYQNIKLNASIDSNKYVAELAINDSALVLNLDGAASFAKGSEFINANANIARADLQQMNLTTDKIVAQVNVQAKSEGDIKDLNASVRLGDLVVKKDKETYRLDSLLVLSASDSIHSTLSVKSEIVQAEYDGTVKLLNVAKVVLHHVNQYFKITEEKNVAKADSTTQNFKLTAKVLPHPILTKVLVPKLENFTGATVAASFDGDKKSLSLNVDASSLAYSGVNAADVKVQISSDEKAMNYSLSLADLTTGPVKLSETSLSGSVANNDAGFALRIHGKDTIDKLSISGNLQQDSNKTYTVFLDNKKLILGNEPWQLSENNFIRFGKQGLFVNNFNLSNNGQGISIQSDEVKNGLMKVRFDKFELGSLSQIIETDTAFARGEVDGNIEFRDINKTPAFVSDLSIKNIHFKTLPVGDIALKADNLSASNYTAQITLTGFDNNVEVKGNYSTANKSNALNFNVAINRLNLISIEPFTGGQIRRSSGYITGALKVSGAVAKPDIDGDVRFKNAAFNLAYINNYLQLKDEQIAIDGKGIYFRSFNILDSLGQLAAITGAVYTTDFRKFKFDANIKTDNFTVLNTTMADNQLFFGRVLLNSNISIKGTEQLPVVNVSAKLIDGSNIAIVIPSSKISTDRGEGVVVLRDLDSLSNKNISLDTVQLVTGFKGIKLNANLEITRNTKLKLIVDKTSGDSLVISGDGVLNFSMNESGNQNLTGTYYIKAGGYNATFQKIIKRELAIQPGGYITWNGSPTDANVDIAAVYTVKTAPADLLANELSAATTEEKNVYKRLMVFKVIMRMKGALLKPEISFKLDMNEADQNAFGGSVYSKISSLNNDPSELNKQVFALLILNKFIPAGVGGGNGYAAMATDIARNSLNQVLTDQLNKLSGKYIKGVDLSVGINANDEYTATGVNQNTQLSVGVKKSFFKDRLSVQVGTSVKVQNDNGEVQGLDANNLTGDIIVEYKINEDGSLRFKVFRENQYVGLIDGSLYKTGVGIVFSRDYDKEKELFTRKKSKKKEQEKIAPSE